MGKGDKKTRKGKIWKSSYGKKRRKNSKANKNIQRSNLRYWSIERIYSDIGQFDFTCNILFKVNSESYLKYKRNATGVIYYTKKERQLLKSRLNAGIQKETDGKVKYKLVLKNEHSNQQIKELFKLGFNNADILDIFYYPIKHNQTYFNKMY